MKLRCALAVLLAVGVVLTAAAKDKKNSKEIAAPAADAAAVADAAAGADAAAVADAAAGAEAEALAAAAPIERPDAKLASKLAFGLEWNWQDAPGAPTDWTVAGGGPTAVVAYRSSYLGYPVGGLKLKAGPFLDLAFTADSKSRGAAGANPYLVLGAASGRAELGLRLDWKFEAGLAELDAAAELAAAADLDQYTDADPDYLPLGADAEAFWTRLALGGGGRVGLGLTLAKDWSVSAAGGYFARFNPEDAYGAAGAPGFRAAASAGAAWEFGDKDIVAGGLALSGSAGWDSGIVLTERRLAAEFAARLDFAKLFRLGFAPVSCYEKRAGADFAGPPTDVRRWIGSVVSWRNDLAGGKVGVKLACPWPGSESWAGADFASGRWELSAVWEIEQ
jgi:hypothetical protein